MATDSPPFQRRAFLAVAVVWLVLDAIAWLVWEWLARSHVQTLQPALLVQMHWVGLVWVSLFGAKLTLLAAWLLLGEGHWLARLGGALGLVYPAILFQARMTGFGPVIGSLCVAPFALGALLFPYWLLKINDYELTREPVNVAANNRQFSVRQLMFVTLLAALVMTLLRWSDTSVGYAVYGFLVILFAWPFPFMTSVGLLAPQWYPSAAFAGGLTLYLLSLPFWTLKLEDAAEAFAAEAIYASFLIAHLLLLRRLGYRLTRSRVGLHRRLSLRADEKVEFASMAGNGHAR